MKSFYPTQKIDLRFRIDYITPMKITRFEEYETAPEHTSKYMVLIEHKDIKIVSDRNKKTRIKLI